MPARTLTVFHLLGNTPSWSLSVPASALPRLKSKHEHDLGLLPQAKPRSATTALVQRYRQRLHLYSAGCFHPDHSLLIAKSAIYDQSINLSCFLSLSLVVHLVELLLLFGCACGVHQMLCSQNTTSSLTTTLPPRRHRDPLPHQRAVAHRRSPPPLPPRRQEAEDMFRRSRDSSHCSRASVRGSGGLCFQTSRAEYASTLSLSHTPPPAPTPLFLSLLLSRASLTFPSHSLSRSLSLSLSLSLARALALALWRARLLPAAAITLPREEGEQQPSCTARPRPCHLGFPPVPQAAASSRAGPSTPRAGPPVSSPRPSASPRSLLRPAAPAAPPPPPYPRLPSCRLTPRPHPSSHLPQAQPPYSRRRSPLRSGSAAGSVRSVLAGRGFVDWIGAPWMAAGWRA